tara:strand:- start:4484 stop:5395 length:912 start_codon:yes stop_codon:yes gene_type:complete
LKKVLITGALGQNGKILSNIYSKKNYQVSGFIKKNQKNKIKGISYFNNNLLNKKKIEKHLHQIKPNVILHLASRNDSYSKRLKKDNYKNNYIYNLKITKNLVDAIIKTGIKSKLIFAGSSVMFSNQKKSIVSEKDKFGSREFYGKYKIDAHNYIHLKTNKKFKATTVILFNHDSVYRNKKFLIPRLIEAVKKKKIKFIKKIFIENINGDFSHAEDICKGIFKVSINNKNIKSIILSSGKRFYLNSLLKYFIKKNKIDLQISKNQIKKNSENYKFLGSNLLAKKLINYKPRKNLMVAAKKIFNI